VYPLKPVITDDPTWKSVYDDDPESVNLTSACISTREAKGLLAEGAVFETVVLLNDAGEDLVEQIAPKGAEHPDLVTRVERLCLADRSPESVAFIHDYLKDQPMNSVFFGTGGG